MEDKQKDQLLTLIKEKLEHESNVNKQNVQVRVCSNNHELFKELFGKPKEKEIQICRPTRRNLLRGQTVNVVHDQSSLGVIKGAIHEKGQDKQKYMDTLLQTIK